MRQFTSILPYIGVMLCIFALGRLLRHQPLRQGQGASTPIHARNTHHLDDSKNLKLYTEDGEKIFNLDVTQYFNQPLKMWDYRNEAIAFMHIGKSGGTSLDRALLTSKHKDGCKLKVAKTLDPVRNLTCPGSVQVWLEK